MKKNDERVGLVCALGAGGEGIVKQDGIVVFLPFALLGEKVRYKILKVTSKYAYGKVLEIYAPAEIRERPACPVYTKCGGCQLQHIRYFNQLKLISKSKIFANSFTAFFFTLSFKFVTSITVKVQISSQ